jgi:uroporphyrinogen decarboxylase
MMEGECTMKFEMTSRERILAGLDHKKTDRIPFAFVCSGVNLSAKKKLMEYLAMSNIDEVDNYLKDFSDIKGIGLRYKGPKEKNTRLNDGTRIDIWGVERKPVSYGDGSYDEISFYPLKDVQDIKELDTYRWPSVDWWNADDIKDRIKAQNTDGEYACMIGNGNVFESSWYMRGFEQMFMDLIMEPELAWEIMKRVTDYYIAFFKKALEAADGMIDIVFTADDIAGQEGLLMSLDMWEEIIKPHHMRLNKLLHEYGVKIIYHSDGAVMKAVPGLMDMGIDILQALQFDAKGMDPVELKEKYGDKLCFQGGVSVQSTLPFGTVEQVKQEVKERIDILGENGGYILGPSHVIQAGTPPENIAAMLETARNHYFR